MAGMHGFGLTDRPLAELYRTTAGPVAYIDESYREPLHKPSDPCRSPGETHRAPIGGISGFGPGSLRQGRGQAHSSYPGPQR